MSAVLTLDVSYLKAYPVGRPFFVRKHLTSVTGVAKGPLYCVRIYVVPAPEGRVVTGIRPPEHNITKAAALPLVNRTAPGILSSDVATVVLVRA
jgi:hypothetical protein